MFHGYNFMPLQVHVLTPLPPPKHQNLPPQSIDVLGGIFISLLPPSVNARGSTEDDHVVACKLKSQ